MFSSKRQRAPAMPNPMRELKVTYTRYVLLLNGMLSETCARSVTIMINVLFSFGYFSHLQSDIFPSNPPMIIRERFTPQPTINNKNNCSSISSFWAEFDVYKHPSTRFQLERQLGPHELISIYWIILQNTNEKTAWARILFIMPDKIRSVAITHMLRRFFQYTNPEWRNIHFSHENRIFLSGNSMLDHIQTYKRCTDR